jgi:RNA-directed DNA polymerase
VLDELDRELERRGHRFVRYADDCNLYVHSERAGRRVMRNISRFLTRRLKLKVNEGKSAVARTGERKFLGFSVSNDREPKRRIAPKALLRCKQRIRELTSRTRGIRIKQMVAELAVYLRGWKSYFGFCETPSVLKGLDHWIRRRLRSVIWKQRKRRSSWRMANSPALSVPFPNAYFDGLGLPRLCAG